MDLVTLGGPLLDGGGRTLFAFATVFRGVAVVPERAGPTGAGGSGRGGETVAGVAVAAVCCEEADEGGGDEAFAA